MLHRYDLQWFPTWVDVVLLNGMIPSQSKECRGWSVTCDSNYAIDCRDVLTCDGFGPDVPSARLPAGVALEASLMSQTHQSKLTRLRAVLFDHFWTKRTSMDQSLCFQVCSVL